MHNDSSPPHRLKSPATAPLVNRTKNAFNTAIMNACLFFIKKRAYMTAIFDSPNLIPGTVMIKGGRVFSTMASTNATANSNPVNTNSYVLLR